MPRKSKGRSSNIVRVPFQAYLTTALTAGTLQQSLHPSALSNLAAISSVYELYRYTQLSYQLQPRPTSGNSLTVGYYPDATITSPSGQSQALENLDARVIAGAGLQTVPVSHTIPPARLRGQLEWYKAVQDAAANEFEVQGYLSFFGTGTEAVNTIVRGVCEFKNPIDAGTAYQVVKKKVMDEMAKELNEEYETDDVAPTSVIPVPSVRQSPRVVKTGGPRFKLAT